MAPPAYLEKKLETINSIDDLTREEQLALVVEEGVSRIPDIASSVEEVLDQLKDEGISAGFFREDVKRAIEFELG